MHATYYSTLLITLQLVDNPPNFDGNNEYLFLPSCCNDLTTFSQSGNYAAYIDWALNWRWAHVYQIARRVFCLMVLRRSWSLVVVLLLVLDLVAAMVDGLLLAVHLCCFWRIPYLMHDIRFEHPHGSLTRILMLSSLQGVMDLFFLPLALVLLVYPLHTPVIIGAMVESCRKPREIPFRIFVFTEFFFAIFEAIFVICVLVLSLHRAILVPKIYWDQHRSNFFVPGIQRNAEDIFWIFAGGMRQNVIDAWNDVFTLAVVIPCFIPMILAPWRLLRALSLCFVTDSERSAFYRTRFTAKVIYYMKLSHDEIKDLSHRACIDCKNGRFLWMQYRMRRFEELRRDTTASIAELAYDINYTSIDHGLDAKPDDRRLVASMRIIRLCSTLQEKMFKDRCVMFPDEGSASLKHVKDEFSYHDIIQLCRDPAVQSYLESLYLRNPSDFVDPESFEKLSQNLAADIGELDDRLQNDCQYEALEKCLIKLHMCSSASHHSKQADFDDCLDKVMKIETVTVQNIIKNLSPQPLQNMSGYSFNNFPERNEIRIAFVACLMLSLFDIFVVCTLPLALFRHELLFSAIQSSRRMNSTRAAMYCAFRIAFRVFLDGILALCSLGILISVVGTLPFISRMHDAWKSRSVSYARNIIIVIVRDFVKLIVSSLASCGTYNFAILFWSLFLVGFWAGFLPAMIIYVAASNVEFLKNHKLLGCCFSFSFWTSVVIIVPMYGLFINVASPRVVGSEFGSVIWFLIIMILISVISAVHLSLNRDQTKPVFSETTQRLPTRKNFENACALFDVILDGIQ
jgi:hypothetical protein